MRSNDNSAGKVFLDHPSAPASGERRRRETQR
jgi:hypothetical protein